MNSFKVYVPDRFKEKAIAKISALGLRYQARYSHFISFISGDSEIVHESISSFCGLNVRELTIEEFLAIPEPKKKVKFYQWFYKKLNSTSGKSYLQPCTGLMTEDCRHIDGHKSNHCPDKLVRAENHELEIEVDWT